MLIHVVRCQEKEEAFYTNTQLSSEDGVVDFIVVHELSLG